MEKLEKTNKQFIKYICHYRLPWLTQQLGTTCRGGMGDGGGGGGHCLSVESFIYKRAPKSAVWE